MLSEHDKMIARVWSALDVAGGDTSPTRIAEELLARGVITTPHDVEAALRRAQVPQRQDGAA